MASITSKTGEYITQGLQSRKVCDHAMQVAQREANRRNETVYLEDDGEEFEVCPDIEDSEIADHSR